uniref:Uncharacterized protein LOC105051150 isoform X4 n=1 Tax=Elaeis guineensis var. tenera TaxID=51953 RepID=A0A6I9RPC8_ELAGV|nr:uncharacterized protein LOC105051150 isoform X4 [Elaeis guineensis]
MRLPNLGSMLTDTGDKRAYFCSFLLLGAVLGLACLVGTPSFVSNKGIMLGWGAMEPTQNKSSTSCKTQCKPSGSEPLPNGIVSRTSNLEMQPMWGSLHTQKEKHVAKASQSLLAMAVGIKQKTVVDQIVEKFFSSNFTIMLFHYDGVVDEWRDLQWSDSALHVSAINQTKCYISIIEREGLEISQPALDVAKSEVHHQITARGRQGDVHRRIYKSRGGGRCYENSTAPPCTGWVEMMAPVFSRAAWRCVWYMIQNDLIHAWGLDMKLGYCCQGDRTKNVGVVDSEYIVHMGTPTLGGFDENKSNAEQRGHAPVSESSYLGTVVPHGSSGVKDRYAVRRRSYVELRIFLTRWKNAVAEDQCWNDPYPEAGKKLKY